MQYLLQYRAINCNILQLVVTNYRRMYSVTTSLVVYLNFPLCTFFYFILTHFHGRKHCLNPQCICLNCSVGLLSIQFLQLLLSARWSPSHCSSHPTKRVANICNSTPQINVFLQKENSLGQQWTHPLSVLRYESVKLGPKAFHNGSTCEQMIRINIITDSLLFFLRSSLSRRS